MRGLSIADLELDADELDAAQVLDGDPLYTVAAGD
jgi:hypothetical protein